VRGGLDDALEKLARRDELRRRAAGQAAGTPAAVTELVEAVAAVVARNPELAITMGVEGAGEPVLLTFAVDDGIVQVSADNPLSAQVTEAAPASGRHADFDLDLDPVVEPDEIYADPPVPSRYAETTLLGYPDTDDVTTAPSYDAPHPYEEFRQQYAASGLDGPSFDEPSFDGPGFDEPDPDAPGFGRAGFDDGASFEDTLSYHKKFGKPEATYDPPAEVHEGLTAFARPQERYEAPVAAAPPPQVPPQTRGRVEEPAAPRQMPPPMPTPMPRGAEPEVTEMAAKRLAAMLREDPSLLQPNPHD
jgi:hypothetical protein